MALLAAATRLLLHLLLPPHRMQSSDAQKRLELPVWTQSSSWSGITVQVVALAWPAHGRRPGGALSGAARGNAQAVTMYWGSDSLKSCNPT